MGSEERSMETISALLNDAASLGVLWKVLALTVFYAAIAWLPLRGTAAVVRHWQDTSDRKRQARTRRLFRRHLIR